MEENVLTNFSKDHKSTSSTTIGPSYLNKTKKWNTQGFLGQVATATSYATGVHKYSHSPSHGLWWQVRPKFCPNNTAVTMWPCNFAPNAPVISSVLLGFCLVNIGHPFAAIPVHFLWCIDSFNLN